MDSKYITPFIDATKNVFKEFFNIEPDVKKPYYMDKKEIYDWDISAIIGIAGDAKGAIVLSFKKNIAFDLAYKLTGKYFDNFSEEVIDTVGEIVNIVSGNAKKGLEEFRLMISLPSVIKGSGHEIVFPGKSLPIIVIPFMIPKGKFHLSVCLENIIE